MITRLFVPGQEGFELQESRAGVVLERILALSDDDVRSSLEDVIVRFDGRHRDLMGTFRRHARELADRLDPGAHLSDARILGGFNWSSQHLDHGGVVWPSVRTRNRLVGDGSGRLTVRCGLRCAHQGARTRRGRCSVSFGG